MKKKMNILPYSNTRIGRIYEHYGFYVLSYSLIISHLTLWHLDRILTLTLRLIKRSWVQ